MDFARRAGGREATFTRVFYAPGKTTYFDQLAVGNYSNIGPPSVRLGTDYSINEQHSVGFIGYFGMVKGEQDFLTDTYIGDAPGQPSQAIDANNYSEGTYTNGTGNFHYVFKPDTLGSQLSADLDYVRISNIGEGNFYNTFMAIADGSAVQDNLYTHMLNGYDIASAKMDYSRPILKKYKLEAGGRVSRVESDNDFRFYFNNAGLVSDPQRTNYFNYRERIYAGYLNWSGPLNKKLTLQAGLRGEQTESRGESYTTGQVTDRSYFGLFPSVFLQHALSEQYAVNYSYSRRLTRPNYGNLNPFRSYRDPYTWTEGNPLLRPSYAHSFNLVQTYKKAYTLTLAYQLDKDLMSELPILDVERNITIYTTGNVDDAHNADATALVPVKFTKWWDSQNTLQLSYSRFSTMSNNGPLVNKQTSYMIQSVHTVRLPRDVRGEINLFYRGPEAYGLYRMAALSRVDVGLRKSFLKKKLDVTVQATDLFRGQRLRWTTDINGNVNDFDQYFRNRRVGVVLRYKFSRGQKVEERRRDATVEEMSRT